MSSLQPAGASSEAQVQRLLAELQTEVLNGNGAGPRADEIRAELAELGVQ